MKSTLIRVITLEKTLSSTYTRLVLSWTSPLNYKLTTQIQDYSVVVDYQVTFNFLVLLQSLKIISLDHISRSSVIWWMVDKIIYQISQQKWRVNILHHPIVTDWSHHCLLANLYQICWALKLSQCAQPILCHQSFPNYGKEFLYPKFISSSKLELRKFA